MRVCVWYLQCLQIFKELRRLAAGERSSGTHRCKCDASSLRDDSIDKCYPLSGSFVSEGTAVIIPTFTLHRDPRYFSPQPNHFIPERWLSNQATKDGTVYVTDREAFIPFSYGPANCAGKVFAMAELRCVIAMLVRSFDMHHLVGPGSDDPAVLEEKARLWMNGLKDRLVFERPGFRVYMAVRKSVN